MMRFRKKIQNFENILGKEKKNQIQIKDRKTREKVKFVGYQSEDKSKSNPEKYI